MANAAGGEGSRGKAKGSEQGIAGVRLQNLLPRARVLYASATGASDVNNLAYATRLGLWGPETAFANREAFVRSEEHTSELQSLMRISYAVFCLKKKKNTTAKSSHIRLTPNI